MTDIVNKSLEEGMFPSAFKTADMIPLLKKPSIDKNDLVTGQFLTLVLFRKLLKRIIQLKPLYLKLPMT